MRLGIFAPYAPGEATQAAYSLADLCRGLGCDVSFGSLNPVKHRIHEHWDSRVRRVRKRQLDAWAAKFDTVILFDFQKQVMQQLAQQATRSVVVATRRVLEYDYQDLRTYLPLAQAVITPNEETHNHLSARLRDVELTNIPWHTGHRSRQQRRNMVGDDGELHLFLRIDGHTTMQDGRHLLSALDVLMGEFTSLFVTLDMPRRSHKSISVRLDELSRDYRGRFRSVHRQARDARCNEYDYCDWTVCLGSHGVFGLDALESLSHGVPVAAFQHAPYAELVQHNYSGYLATCETLGEISGLPCGHHEAIDFLQLLHRLCSDPERLDLVRAKDWAYLKNRYQTFRMGWKRLLDC